VGLCLLLWIVGATFVVSVSYSVSSHNFVYAFIAGLMAAGVIDGFVEVMFVSVRELGLFLGMCITMLYAIHPRDQAGLQGLFQKAETARPTPRTFRSIKPNHA
jgi:hypothetical protein